MRRKYLKTAFSKFHTQSVWSSFSLIFWYLRKINKKNNPIIICSILLLSVILNEGFRIRVEKIVWNRNKEKEGIICISDNEWISRIYFSLVFVSCCCYECVEWSLYENGMLNDNAWLVYLWLLDGEVASKIILNKIWTWL